MKSIFKKTLILIMIMLVCITAFPLRDAHAAAPKVKKIGGSYYIFKKNGRMREKWGWVNIGEKKYYVMPDCTLATGVNKIGRDLYSFSKKGVLLTNRKAFRYNKNYYRTDSRGVMVRMTEAQVKASRLTWKYINKHSDRGDSNATRFRKCFRHLVAYMHYRPGYIRIQELKGREWPYRCVNKVLGNNVTGNCYGFACTVASIAHELGYEPYIVVMSCDHAVVMINGKYYDNMGARFGTKSPAIRSFNVYKKVRF